VSLLEAKSVDKTYVVGTTKLQVLRALDLSVEKGEMVAIVGASGVGKSTLLHVLGGLDAIDAGSVRIGEQDLGAMKPDALTAFRNRAVGFVFQFHHLLPEFTALENAGMPMRIARRPAEEREARAAAMLARVGLTERAVHNPGMLSGGEQQRVAIARALVTQPTLLLADEPTGNLDSHMTVEVMALFQDLNDQGITILIVTHEPDVAKYAKRIVEVRDGHIIRDHPVEDRRRAADDLLRLELEDPLEPVMTP
jgi:putative ABC transport system ATP-binding protein